jgi:pimeloyl-ACP methyl ester carboxylesterase
MTSKPRGLIASVCPANSHAMENRSFGNRSTIPCVLVAFGGLHVAAHVVTELGGRRLRQARTRNRVKDRTQGATRGWRRLRAPAAAEALPAATYKESPSSSISAGRTWSVSCRDESASISTVSGTSLPAIRRRLMRRRGEFYAELYALPGTMHSAFAQFRSIRQDVRDNIASMATKLTMPVLAVGGEKSFGSNEAIVMRNAAVDVAELVIPNSGHWLMEEEPTATIAAIRAFLTSK